VHANPWNPFEIPQIAGHYFQAVVQGGGRDLEVGVRDGAARSRQARLKLTVDTSHGDVIGQDGDRRKNPRFDALQMA